MTHLFLIEMVLVFGAVLAFAFYEWRKAERLSRETRRRNEEARANAASDDKVA